MANPSWSVIDFAVRYILNLLIIYVILFLWYQSAKKKFGGRAKKYKQKIVLLPLATALVFSIISFIGSTLVSLTSVLTILGAIVAGFIALFGLLFLVASNMMRGVSELKFFYERTIWENIIKVGTNPDTKQDPKENPIVASMLKRLESGSEFYRNKMNALRDWFSYLWYSTFFLIVYCMVLMVAASVSTTPGLEAKWIIFAMFGAALDLYLVYRIVITHIKEIPEQVEIYGKIK